MFQLSMLNFFFKERGLELFSGGNATFIGLESGFLCVFSSRTFSVDKNDEISHTSVIGVVFHLSRELSLGTTFLVFTDTPFLEVSAEKFFYNVIATVGSS